MLIGEFSSLIGRGDSRVMSNNYNKINRGKKRLFGVCVCFFGVFFGGGGGGGFVALHLRPFLSCLHHQPDFVISSPLCVSGLRIFVL